MQYDENFYADLAQEEVAERAQMLLDKYPQQEQRIKRIMDNVVMAGDKHKWLDAFERNMKRGVGHYKSKYPDGVLVSGNREDGTALYTHDVF